MSRQTLAEQAANRELAVLVDGPFRLAWYWRDELEQMQQASVRTGHPNGHPAARMRGYRPTEQRQAHPIEDGVSGRVWRYQEPPTP